MNTTQITFRNMRRSAALAERIRVLSERLEGDDPRVMNCRVAIEALGKHQRHGRQYQVSVNVHVPGHEIVANQHGNEDVHAALRDAFAAVTRQLEESRDVRH
jgi:ribosome-associated translation inhibitor RaiA